MEGIGVNDPKYKFGSDDSIYHRYGEYFIEPDEPVMLLRGKDVTSLAAILGYINALESMYPNDIVDSHLDSSLERLHAFWLYQISSGKSGVGCSQKHHSGSELYICEAETKLREHLKI